MSVFVLSPEEFGSIAATLRVARDSYGRLIFLLSFAERWEHNVLVEPFMKQDEEEYALSLIDPFVYRLYLANALAERYTYMKPDDKQLSISLLDLPEARPVSLRKLLGTLGSLSYNVVTNGGNTFLGVKDDEKLKQVIDAVKSELIHTRIGDEER